jgi:hypothetical protein
MQRRRRRGIFLHPPTGDDDMAKDRAIFQDARGRSWLVEILYGHPAPTERGIYAARFRCPEDEAESVRLGFVEIEAVEHDDPELLLEALEMSDPAEEIGD